MPEISVSLNILASILFTQRVKYNLSGDLIFFRAVGLMKVKNMKNCKAIFDFKHMWFFLIYLVLWLLGDLSNMIDW